MFTRKEKQIRKHWLISMICANAIWFITLLIEAFDKNFNNIFLTAVLTLIILLFKGLIFYHCVYKKNGTKLLAWFVYITPFYMFKDIISGDINEWVAIFRDPFSFWFVLLVYSANVWYWINGINLLKVNKRIQEIKLNEKEG